MKKGFISAPRMRKERRLKAFTLIELLVVIVIIAILAAVIFVALDPITRFKQARDSQRWNAVNNILTAVHEYLVDNAAYPTGLSTGMAETQLGTALTGCADCGTVAACVDLSTPLARYMALMPQDPATGSAEETRFSIQVDANGIVWVRACDEEMQADPPGIYVAR